MLQDSIIFYVFLIFTGASILATLALATRQSLVVAYIVLGMLIGPWGFQWIKNPDLVMHLSDMGIVFLLFLLGLDLDPKSLLHLFRGTTIITFLSSTLFGIVGFGAGQLLGYSFLECAVVGAAMMFSSTIIALKLLPTTVLHHQKMGGVMISILLLQDIFAIIVLVALDARKDLAEGAGLFQLVSILLGLPGLLLCCSLFERYVLSHLFQRFDKIQEYIFLLAIGWSLGIAVLAESLGLSYEIGAFIAGVVIAVSPISHFIVDRLKPLRDFFLVLFFFSLGATLNLTMLDNIIIPAALLAITMLLLKPFVFKKLLSQTKELQHHALELGVRLGQISEFSLLIAYLAHSQELIGDLPYFLIQTSTILTFMVSSYWVVLRYPTPVAIKESLRRD